MPSRPVRSRYIGDTDAAQIWWFISGTLVDFHTGYTFVAKCAPISDETSILFTKTTGFVGAVGSGVEGNGTANLVVSWANSGELDLCTDGSYILEIVATKTADGSTTTYQMQLDMQSRLG
jgi:hypothetical protein